MVARFRALGCATRRSLAVALGTPPAMLGRPWVFDLARLGGVLVVAVLSSVVAFSSAFLWAFVRYPGAHGVFALVAIGAPVWVLAVPGVAVLVVLCLFWPYPGKFEPVLVFATAAFALTLVAGAVLQGKGSESFNLAAGLSLPAVLIIELCALALAMSDAFPPDRPFAALARYFSVRQLQFYDLYQWGRTHDWRVRTVDGRAVGVMLQGAPDPFAPQIRVTVRCLCAHASRPPRLSIQVAWPQELPWFYVGTMPTRVSLPPGTVAVRWRRKLGRSLWGYIGPDPDGAPASVRRLGELHALAQQSGLSLSLWGHGALWRTSTGLSYRWRPGSLTPLYPTMGTLTWLEEVAALLAKS